MCHRLDRPYVAQRRLNSKSVYSKKIRSLLCNTGRCSHSHRTPSTSTPTPARSLLAPATHKLPRYFILTHHAPPSARFLALEGGVGETQEHWRAVRDEDPEEGGRGAEAAGGEDKDRAPCARERGAPLPYAASLRLPGLFLCCSLKTQQQQTLKEFNGVLPSRVS